MMKDIVHISGELSWISHHESGVFGISEGALCDLEDLIADSACLIEDEEHAVKSLQASLLSARAVLRIARQFSGDAL